jgi:hypothetical protein
VEVKMNRIERIAKIKTRLFGATKGPWKVRDYYGPSGVASAIYRSIAEIGVEGMFKGDAEFIANSRDDIQYLIAELETFTYEEHRKLSQTLELAVYWENEARQLDQENIEYRDALAYILYQSGDYTTAESVRLALIAQRARDTLKKGDERDE